MNAPSAPLYFSTPSEYVGVSHTLQPRAKLNLRLKIEGRREDGYHLLSMLNVLTDLCDELTVSFSVGSGCEIAVVHSPDTPSLGDAEKNLASIAARRFLEEFKIPLKAVLSLKKVIPIGAGFGGGSSDAGTLLAHLVDCFSAHIEKSEGITKDRVLVETMLLAAKVGADVPFFVRGGLARVTGVGEHVERYDARFLAGIPVLIVVPASRCPTKEIYESFRQRHPVVTPLRDMPGERFGEMLRLNTAMEGYEPHPSRTIRASLWRQLLPMVGNDLEPTVCEFAPEVGALLAAFRTVPEVVCGVTGSGSGVFVLPKTLDYFEKNGTAHVRSVVEGRGCAIIESRLFAPE